MCTPYSQALGILNKLKQQAKMQNQAPISTAASTSIDDDDTE